MLSEREFVKNNDVPNLSDLIEFLKKCTRTLEVSKTSKNINQKQYSKSSVMLTNVKSSKCIYCYDNFHVIF